MQANLPALTARIKQKPAKVGGGFLGWFARREEQLAPTVSGGEAKVISQTTWAHIRPPDPLSRVETTLRKKGASEPYIARIAARITLTDTGRLRDQETIDLRARWFLGGLDEARQYGSGRNRLCLRGLGAAALGWVAVGGPALAAKEAHRNTVSDILREFCEAGLLYSVQLPASKVAKWELGPPKRVRVREPDGTYVWRWERWAYNRIYFCFEDFERPEPEPNEYLEGAVVADLATTPSEDKFLAELDDILANARPRETLCWPAGDVEPPKGGRGPPN